MNLVLRLMQVKLYILNKFWIIILDKYEKKPFKHTNHTNRQIRLLGNMVNIFFEIFDLVAAILPY